MSDRPDENSTGGELDPNVTRQAAPVNVFPQDRVSLGHDESKLDSESDHSAAALLGLPEMVAPKRSLLELMPGEIAGDFEIVRLLGEGGVARVYLAKQRPLDRLVVLKVSANADEEGRTLASLEHDHIVQVFTEQVVDGRRLMAMRYLPSITLARLLELIEGADRSRLTGRNLLDSLDSEVGEPPREPDVPARSEFGARNFVPAVCGLMVGLARALEHAHRQRVLHRDIKPANILFAQNGRAFLMDFNIAGRRDQQSGVFGGTPAYMAPEHLSAMALQIGGKGDRSNLCEAPGGPFRQIGPVPFSTVNERSDIFSLGVVFYELLTGRHPFRIVETDRAAVPALNQMLANRLQGPPSVSDAGFVVPLGVESILRKCLAAESAKRYQRASELADDLESFITDRPLQFAPDPSPRERLGKWLRRHPRWTSAMSAVAAVGFFVLVYVVCSEWWRLGEAERTVVRAAEDLSDSDSTGARKRLEHAGQLLAGRITVLRFFGGDTRYRGARQSVRELAKAIVEFDHRRFVRLADSTRAGAADWLESKSMDDTAAVMLDPLPVFGVVQRDDWQQSEPFQSLEPADKAQVEEDVTELLLLRAIDVMTRWTNTRPAAEVRSGVLEWLARVPERHRDCLAVAQLREQSDGELNQPIPAPDTPPQDWSEFDIYLMGVKEAKQGRLARAVVYFIAAGERCSHADHPLRFWSHFYQADCASRLGNVTKAIIEYGVCIGIDPLVAWPHYNLGHILAKGGDAGQAAKHFQRAIDCDPKLAVAHCNLGAMQVALSAYRGAIESCDRAIELSYRGPEVFCNRGIARAKTGDRAGAIQDFKKALEIDPRSAEALNGLKIIESGQ